MKIALFGGSFNPIHIGHIKIAEFAIKELKLDKLIFIPTFKSIDKLNQYHADPEHRIKMIEFVLPKKCEISKYEINLKKPVLSIDTVKYFYEKYKNEDLYFLLGEDNLTHLENWENIDIIDQLTTIIIFRRFEKRINVNLKICKKIIYLNNDIFNYSSSEFRKNKNKDVLDTKVYEYIKSNKLYNNL